MHVAADLDSSKVSFTEFTRQKLVTMITPDDSFYPSVELALKYELGFGHSIGLVSFLKYAIPLIPPSAQILDAGCGTGRPVGVSLAAAGHIVTGIDVSNAMISLSKAAIPTGHFHVVDSKSFLCFGPF